MAGSIDIEIVMVHPLELVRADSRNAQSEINHHLGEVAAVNEDNPWVNS